MNRLFLAAAAAAALLAAPAAMAQQAAGGYHTHDGFYLHLEGGFGSLGTKTDLGGSSLEISGGASQFALSLGGALTPNLILAGQFWGVSASSPTVKWGGVSGTANGSLGLSGIGLEITYYFMPLDLYLSAVPSIGTLSVSSGGNTGSTKSGFAIKLAVGKEWWVSDNWGIGLNAQYAHGSNEDQGTNPATFNTNYFGAAFSASFN